MADLARLKRMQPFRNMHTAEFNAMVDSLRTLTPTAASGGTGQIVTVRGSAIRGRLAPLGDINAYIAVADQVGNTIDVKRVKSDGTPAGSTITAFVLP